MIHPDISTLERKPRKNRFQLTVLTFLVYFGWFMSYNRWYSPKSSISFFHSKSQDVTQESKNKSNFIGLKTETPVLHVNFLKVRKCGSSTMQNLLFRFALRHNLTVLLPKIYGLLQKRSQAMPIKAGNHYDIFACHTLGSEEAFNLLPDDTVKIGIVRDPLERMISAAYYRRNGLRYLRQVPPEGYIENLIGFPERYEKQPHFSETMNAMGLDFGFGPVRKEQKHIIQSYLDRLKKEYLLVLVLERFYESLVLLKRELNWDLQDILFARSNINKHEVVYVNQTLKSKLRETCFLDYALYDTFYPILEDKIKAQHSSFEEEVAHFKDVNSKVNEFCLLVNSTSKTFEVSESKWNRRFKIQKRECVLMHLKESSFTRRLRKRHKAMQKR